jgi:integrase
MASVFLKRGRFWARLRGDKVPGKWSSVPTGETDRDAALRFAKAAQKSIDARPSPVNRMSYRAWIAEWLTKREEAGQDWKKDKGRLAKHVLPVLGDLELPSVTTKQLADLVHDLRFKTKLANRTVRNVYSVVAASLRDAAIDGRIAVSPCTLTDVQLGAITDKDPEWRSGALFDRDEAEVLISDPRIPIDRRVVYGFGLLAGLRPGEAAALRWRHYDPTRQPLGSLTVALSYATHRNKVKRTKTDAVRYVPVHPTLAALLEQWRERYFNEIGELPEPEKLIIPLPPEVVRTSRTGERFRGWDYTGRRWREVDLPALGWRARSVYDTKSTFITLAIEDGANPAIIRDRVTHTRSKRDAFSGYDRGPHWLETCHEVAKLSIRLLATNVHPLPSDTTPVNGSDALHDDMGSGGGLRILNRARDCNPEAVQGVATTRAERADAGVVLQILARWEQTACDHSDDDE